MGRDQIKCHKIPVTVVPVRMPAPSHGKPLVSRVNRYDNVSQKQTIRQEQDQDININISGDSDNNVIIVDQEQRQYAVQKQVYQDNYRSKGHHDYCSSDSESSEDECDMCGDLEIKAFNRIGITGQLGCDVCICPHNDTTACSRVGCITGECRK